MPDDPDKQQNEENIKIPPLSKPVAGAAADALIGSIAGPVGAAVGGAVGAIAGKRAAAGEPIAPGAQRVIKRLTKAPAKRRPRGKTATKSRRQKATRPKRAKKGSTAR